MLTKLNTQQVIVLVQSLEINVITMVNQGIKLVSLPKQKVIPRVKLKQIQTLIPKILKDLKPVWKLKDRGPKLNKNI